MKTVDYDDVEKHLDAGDVVWIDFEDEPAKTVIDMGKRFGFDRAAVEDAIDIELLPKFEDHDDHLFVVIHSLGSDGARLDTVEIDCFVRAKLLVTVHASPVQSIGWLALALQRHSALAVEGGDTLFGLVAEVIGRRYLEIFVEFERRVDDLDVRALSAHSEVLAEIQMLRREASTVRGVIVPQRLVLSTLRRLMDDEFSDQAKRELSDAYDIHNQVAESLRSTRGLLSDCLDTYLGASGSRQSRASVVLAVYSSVMLPATVLTSWYGMNFAKMPGINAPRGWVWTLVVMGTVAALSLVVFANVGFIRLPRLKGQSSDTNPQGLGDVAAAPTDFAGMYSSDPDDLVSRKSDKRFRPG